MPTQKITDKRWLFVISLFALLLTGAGCAGNSPAASTGGNSEGGAMGSGGTCEAQCTALNAHTQDLLNQKAQQLVKGAGCLLGQGSGAASGKMFGNVDYHCPDQASAEKLGQASQDYKNNPPQSDLDKQIADNQKQIDANCPCPPNPLQVYTSCPSPYSAQKPDCDTLTHEPVAKAFIGPNDTRLSCYACVEVCKDGAQLRPPKCDLSANKYVQEEVRAPSGMRKCISCVPL